MTAYAQVTGVFTDLKTYAGTALANASAALTDMAAVDLNFTGVNETYDITGEGPTSVGTPTIGSFSSEITIPGIEEGPFQTEAEIDPLTGEDSGFSPSEAVGSIAAGTFTPSQTVSGATLGAYSSSGSVTAPTVGSFHAPQSVNALSYVAFTPKQTVDKLGTYTAPDFSDITVPVWAKFNPKTKISKITAPAPEFTVDAEIELEPQPVFHPTGPITVSFDPRPEIDLLSSAAIAAWAPEINSLTVDPAPEVDPGTPPPLSAIDTNITIPTLNLPTYEEVDFGAEPAVPVLNFGFTNERYTSTLLDTIKAKITEVFANGTGLPDAVHARIFLRASEQVEREALQARQQARRDRAALGFDSPPGALSIDLSRIAQRRHDALSKLNREQFINDHQVELEEIRYYTAQGVALEGQLINEHAQYLQRELEAARYTLDAAVAIFGIKRDLYNLKARRAEINARVMEAQIRAEIAKLEALRAQVEIKQVQAEVQRTQVESFRARSEALRLTIDRYVAYLRGVEIQQAVEESKIKVFEGRVRAYAEGVRAQSEGVKGWADGVRGEVAKLGVIETQARVFNTEMDGWRTGAQGEIEAKRLTYEAARLEVERINAIIQTLTAKLDSQTRQFAAESQAYTADNQARVAVAGAEADKVRAEATEHQVEWSAKTSYINTQSEVIRQEVARNLLTYQARAAVAGSQAEVVRAAASAHQATASAQSQAASAEASAISAEASVNSARANMLATVAQAQSAALRAEAGVHQAKLSAEASAISGRAAAVGAEARVFSAIVGAKAAISDAQARVVQTEATSWQALVRSQEAAASAAAIAQRALTDEYRAVVAKYEVDGRLEIAKAQELNRKAQLDIERTRANLALRIEAARISLDLVARSQGLKVERARAIAQTNAALASSAMSAMNATAAISDSNSVSTEHRYNY